MHAVCDEKARPVILYLSEGQVSDYNGAKAIIDHFPLSKHLLADRGYDADWFRPTIIPLYPNISRYLYIPKLLVLLHFFPPNPQNIIIPKN